PALSKQCQNEIPSEKKNPITTIRYYLSETSKISLDVYDLAGVHVATLDRVNKERGYYQVLFNGSTLSSGVYFYRLKTNSDVFTQKMILVK
ncbi:MAG: T9SS type A sorting domain-containing protein, partial [Bacteroidetes bacterium]|nr:T9SS type A sorting domain-containing protein [Bacteroidota bacterium]